jgi:hypothetical protein
MSAGENSAIRILQLEILRGIATSRRPDLLFIYVPAHVAYTFRSLNAKAPELEPASAEGPLFYREACPPFRSGRRAINYLMGRSCLLLRNKVMGLWLRLALKFSRLNKLFQNEAGSLPACLPSVSIGLTALRQASSSRQHACFASLGGTGLSVAFFSKESDN